MRDLSILMEPIPFIDEEATLQAAGFRTWGTKDWEKPTLCQGWTRKHMVSHLTLGANFYEKVVSAGIQGNTNPPYGAADKKEFLQKREAAMARMLSLPTDLLVDEFEMEYHRFLRVAGSLGSENLNCPAWHPMGILPVGHFAGMRLFELALHDWDIRAIDQPGASLKENLLTPLLRALPLMQVRFLNLRPAAQTPEGFFRFAPNEAIPWVISVQHGVSDLVETQNTDAEIRGEGATFIFQTTGRITWRKAEKQGKYSIQGDRGKAERLLDALSVRY